MAATTSENEHRHQLSAFSLYVSVMRLIFLPFARFGKSCSMYYETCDTHMHADIAHRKRVRLSEGTGRQVDGQGVTL